MKKVTLFLIALFCLAVLHAQTTNNKQNITNNKPLSNEDFFTKSDLVFYGVRVKIDWYFDQNRDTITVFGYRIFDVYKGDPSLKYSTVYVFRKNDDIKLGPFYATSPNHPDVIPDVLQRNGVTSGYNSNMGAVYFLVESDFPDNGIPERYASFQRYDFLQERDDKLYVFRDNKIISDSKIIGLNDLVFQTHHEFYEYLRQFEGYTVPEPPTSRPKKQPEEYDIRILLKDSAYRMEVEKKMLENHRLVDSIRNEWREQYRREQYRLQDSLQNTTPEHKKKSLH
jgi:hypothetical protein